MIDQKGCTLLLNLTASLKRVANTGGGEWAGPCPFCGGTDRFRVQPHGKNGGRWMCRGCSDGWQDSVEFVMRYDNLPRDPRGYRAACETLGLSMNGERSIFKPANTSVPAPRTGRWPALTSETWQVRAESFSDYARQQLRSAEGAPVRAYLNGRGLSDETVRRAGLGWNPRDWHVDRSLWGLKPTPPKPIWLPAGVVIPWRIGAKLWKVNIRRGEVSAQTFAPYAGDNKYIPPAGVANGLYNADAIDRAEKPVIIVEGEFDALSLMQEAPDLVTPVATGSAGGAHLHRWLAKLALCERVLAAFDDDEAGKRASDWWAHRLPHAVRLIPTRHDVNDMLRAGEDLRTWLMKAL